jgi:predicted O-methyltransferase YrrM
MMGKILPLMNNDEIVDMVSYLHRDCEMLEIGGGNSTLFFSRIVKRLVTIEHNSEWANHIREKMRLSSKCDWQIHVIEPSFPQLHPFHPAEPGQFDKYVEFISTLEKNQFDVVLIDGRDRVRSTFASIPLLKTGGILIIHDFWNREKYHIILQNDDLELISDTNSHINSSNTLVAFRKK